MGKESVAPKLAGTYYKFMLEKLPADFDVLTSEPEASRSNRREPFVLMHMPKPRTRVFVPEPATAVDDATTLTDAPSTPPLAADSETTPERPDSPGEVTGFIERLNLAGTASTSDGGEGEGEGGGAAAASGGEAACAKCGIYSVALKRCTRCLEVAYCGKQ